MSRLQLVDKGYSSPMVESYMVWTYSLDSGSGARFWSSSLGSIAYSLLSTKLSSVVLVAAPLVVRPGGAFAWKWYRLTCDWKGGVCRSRAERIPPCGYGTPVGPVRPRLNHMMEPESTCEPSDIA